MGSHSRFLCSCAARQCASLLQMSLSHPQVAFLQGLGVRKGASQAQISFWPGLFLMEGPDSAGAPLSLKHYIIWNGLGNRVQLLNLFYIFICLL